MPRRSSAYIDQDELAYCVAISDAALIARIDGALCAARGFTVTPNEYESAAHSEMLYNTGLPNMVLDSRSKIEAAARAATARALLPIRNREW